MSTNSNQLTYAIEYSRSLFKDINAWYKNADFKAQILLTLNGTFISFLSASIFMEIEVINEIQTLAGWETWLFLCILTLSIILSIGAALTALLSRLSDPKELAQHLQEIVNDD